jgi:uncharacterized protein with PIN domain
MSIAYGNCPYCNEEMEFYIEDEIQGVEEIQNCPKCKKDFEWYWEASIDIFTNEIKEEKK